MNATGQGPNAKYIRLTYRNIYSRLQHTDNESVLPPRHNSMQCHPDSPAKAARAETDIKKKERNEKVKKGRKVFNREKRLPSDLQKRRGKKKKRQIRKRDRYVSNSKCVVCVMYQAWRRSRNPLDPALTAPAPRRLADRAAPSRRCGSGLTSFRRACAPTPSSRPQWRRGSLGT